MSVVAGILFGGSDTPIIMHTTMPHDPQAAALLAHVVSQIQSNVDFLLAQNYISPSDASSIVSLLPAGTVDQLAQPIPVGSPQTPTRRRIPAPPLAHRLQARALWAYNVNGEVCTNFYLDV
jgi:LAS seventeen-binding protein 1/2